MRGEVVSSILAGCKFKWLNNSNILIIGIHVRLLVNMTVSHTMWWRLEIMFYYCDLGGDHCKLMPLIANLGIYLQSRCRLQCLAMPSQHFRHYDGCKAFRDFPTLNNCAVKQRGGTLGEVTRTVSIFFLRDCSPSRHPLSLRRTAPRLWQYLGRQNISKLDTGQSIHMSIFSK